MKTIEERAWEKYPEVIKHHNLAKIDTNEEKRRMYIDIAVEMEQDPSDALIMRILNCIGYEDESWIEFVRKELEKRKEK